MKIFVTGGTGFIGPHVLDALMADGHEILLLVRKGEDVTRGREWSKLSMVEGNLANVHAWAKRVAQFRPTACVHMAWEGIPDYGPESGLRNLIYGFSLIRTMGEMGCGKILVTGSCWEYGMGSGRVREDMPVYPRSAFSAAKNALHFMGGELAELHGMQLTWGRLFYVYGPGQKRSCLIPSIIDCVKKNRVPVVKTPAACHDFIYVCDVAEAICGLLKKGTAGAYNIGSGKKVRVSEVAKYIYKELRATCPRSLAKAARNGEQRAGPGEIWADIGKIRRETGWTPKTCIEEGIHRTIIHTGLAVLRSQDG